MFGNAGKEPKLGVAGEGEGLGAAAGDAGGSGAEDGGGLGDCCNSVLLKSAPAEARQGSGVVGSCWCGLS